MLQTMLGRAFGTTIELFQPVGVPDGQAVEVTLRVVPSPAVAESWGEGIRLSAGPLPDDSPRDDQLLAEIQQRRRAARLRPVTE